MVKPSTALPAWVDYDDLGRIVAPRESLVPNPDNPRNADDFIYEKSKAFRDLCHSIDEVGVREPIPVFLADGRPHQAAGHRRAKAVDWVNQRREDAYQAQLSQGKLSPTDPRPVELQPIKFVPITLVAPPQSPFDREADMWLAESQRVKWPINKLVPFFARTYDSAPPGIKDDPDYLARRLGLPVARIRLLINIVTSQVLTQAATAAGEMPLPTKGREKTLRAINRAADVIAKYRPEVALKVTGRYRTDEATNELLREAMVRKASEIFHVQGQPPGVALERIAPKLRYKEQYDDARVVDWATGPGTIAEEIMPTTVRGPGRGRSVPAGAVSEPRPDEVAERGNQMLSIVEVVTAYERMELSELSEPELSALIADLTRAAEGIDNLLVSARKTRRSRVA